MGFKFLLHLGLVSTIGVYHSSVKISGRTSQVVTMPRFAPISNFPKFKKKKKSFLTILSIFDSFLSNIGHFYSIVDK